MVNEPPPGERKPHPLERKPTVRQPETTGEAGKPRQRVTLRIPGVPPHVTYTLLAVNIAVFIMRALSPTFDESIFLWGANMPPAVLLEGEYHRLLTAMFLHAGIYGSEGQLQLANSLHLILNMYVLYNVGTQLEAMFGHMRFAIIYLLGGLAGSVMTAVLSDSRVASVGASGAVFAIIGAELVFLYRHRKLFGAAGRAQLQHVVTWALINFAYGALNSVLASRIRIDNWGHLGGFLGGLALAWFIAPYYLPREDPAQPGTLLAEDDNPLSKRYGVLSLYVSVLLIALIVGAAVARA